MPIAKVIKYTQPTKVIERQALDVAYPYRYGRASDSYNITFYGLTDGDRQQLYQLLGSATPISFSTTSGLYTGIPTKVDFKLSAGVQEYYDGEIDLQAGAVWTPSSGINYLSQIPGLVGYWPFDEGSGNYAYDYSGNGNTGTLVNSPIWVQGKFGGALSFDGTTNRYVNIPTLTLNLATSPYTFVAWVNVLNQNLNPSYASAFVVSDNNAGIGFSIAPSGSGFGVKPWANGISTVHGTFSLNTWHQIVVVYPTANSVTRSVYVDGQLIGTSTDGSIPPSVTATIGGLDGYTQVPSIIVDDVRIYNRALSPSEIQQIYVNTNKADFPPMFGRSVNINDYSYVNVLTNLSENGLIAYWPFEEGSGPKTRDASGNGNTGIVPSGPSGVLYYVPITLSNNQASATPTNFQQMLTINWSSYSSYLNSGVTNVAFFDSNGNLLPAWCESNPSNTASSSVVWVNLKNNIIPASSSITIYLGFLSTSTNNMSPNGVWGEAPNLSPTYGQYDNGSQVFLNYFNGGSLTGWTTAGIAGQTSSAPSGSPFGTNAFYANGAFGDYLYTVANGQSTNMIIEYYTYTANLDDLFFLVNSAGAGQLMRVGNGGGWYGVSSTFSWTSWNAPPNTGSWSNEWVLVGVVINNGQATGYLSTTLSNYGTEIGQNPSNTYIVTNNGNYFGLVGDSNIGATTQYWNGIIIRAYPPAGVMPSASFGSVQQSMAWVQGKYGNALQFVAANSQYVNVGNNINLIQKSFSISAWINLTSVPSGDNPIFDLEGSQTNDHYLHLVVRSGKLFFGFYGDDLSGNTSLTTNQWYFATFVYNYATNTKQIYLNGVLDAQGASTSYFQGSGPANIGKAFTSYANGIIDEVRIYTQALSASQIQQLYLNNNIFSVNQVSFSGLPIQLTTQEQTQSLVGDVFTLINSDVDVYQPVAPELTTWDLSLNTLSFSDVLFLQQAERSQSLVPFTDGAGITHYVFIKEVDYSEYAGKPGYYAVSVQMVSQS